MIPKIPKATHQTLDPITGDCLDCGMSRNQLIDYPEIPCDAVALGPNRVALLLLKQQLRQQDRDISALKQQVERAEHSIARITQLIREREHSRRELVASIDKLS